MTREEFLKALDADAGDEALQLAFSDWLEQHGDLESAEWFRSRVELTAMPREDPRYPALEKAERILWLKWIRLSANPTTWPAVDEFIASLEKRGG